MRRLALILACIAALPACARRVPSPRPAGALYRDVERLVTLAEATGWYADRVEIERLQSDALQSVCRVRPEVRGSVIAWLDREILAAGGPVERAYRARGRDVDEIDDLLTLTRMRLVLADATAAATADCPFWVEPSDGFRGRQISDDRWQLSAAGGGKVMVVRTGGDSDVRFGGAGRLLIGRTTGSRATISTGVELGGRANFPRGEDGAPGGLVLGLDLVVPVVYRHNLINSYLEGEVGWLGAVTEGERGLDHGIHLGAAFGARSSRTRWFFPGAALGASFERTYPDDPAEAPAYLFKIGLRAAFDLDL